MKTKKLVYLLLMFIFVLYGSVKVYADYYRDIVIEEYAKGKYDTWNQAYNYYSQVNCANFVSQCLRYGCYTDTFDV